MMLWIVFGVGVGPSSLALNQTHGEHRFYVPSVFSVMEWEKISPISVTLFLNPNTMAFLCSLFFFNEIFLKWLSLIVNERER